MGVTRKRLPRRLPKVESHECGYQPGVSVEPDQLRRIGLDGEADRLEADIASSTRWGRSPNATMSDGAGMPIRIDSYRALNLFGCCRLGKMQALIAAAEAHPVDEAVAS